MEDNTTTSLEKTTSEVSKETEAVVKKNIPNASEVVKQKTMEVMDAIKNRLQSKLKLAEHACKTLCVSIRKGKITRVFDC